MNGGLSGLNISRQFFHCKMKPRWRVLLIIMFLGPLLSGCIEYSWRAGQLPPSSPLPLQREQNKKSISLNIMLSTDL